MTTSPGNDPIPAASDAGGVDPDLATSSPIKPVADDPPSVPEQRAELAETIDALHDRLDVRERARAEASARADQIKTQATEHRAALAGVAGATIAGVVVLAVRRRRRRRATIR